MKAKQVCMGGDAACVTALLEMPLDKTSDAMRDLVPAPTHPAVCVGILCCVPVYGRVSTLEPGVGVVWTRVESGE